VWEYPVGAHNYDDIDIDGATLISCFDFSIDFHEEPEPDVCEKCEEEFRDERNIGICDSCDEEYNTK
jgi:Zn finger protein HypA/HybF involved in hydrogenase expression